MTGHVRRRGERSWELKYDVGTDTRSRTRLDRRKVARSRGKSSVRSKTMKGK